MPYVREEIEDEIKEYTPYDTDKNDIDMHNQNIINNNIQGHESQNFIKEKNEKFGAIKTFLIFIGISTTILFVIFYLNTFIANLYFVSDLFIIRLYFLFSLFGFFLFYLYILYTKDPNHTLKAKLGGVMIPNICFSIYLLFLKAEAKPYILLNNNTQF